MGFTSLQDDLYPIIEKNLMVNATTGEQSIIRAVIFRLWSQIFSDGNSYKVLVDHLDNLNWNDNLDNLKKLILGLDEILVDISNLVEMNQIINYVELRSRLTWLINFLHRSVVNYVRTALIKLIPSPGFASQIILYRDMDFVRLSHLSTYDSENISAVNLFADYELLEIPKNWIEEILQVGHDIINLK